MSIFPELPEIPPEQRATGHGSLRYEDVSEDGRVLITSLQHFMGRAVFASLLVKDLGSRLNARAGIVPIMARVIAESGEGPISVTKPVEVQGGFALAHTVDEGGEVNRILLENWAEMTAPRSLTHRPPPPGAGKPTLVGRVFAQNVFTRPLAPPDERKVTRLLPGSWPEVPPARRVWRPPEAIALLPDGATWIEDELRPDVAPLVFGLTHTDSNQHVNSLVYPRLFEDAALRRLALLGRSTEVLGRAVEIGYRKPFFAGQSARIELRGYQRAGAVGFVGHFRQDGDSRPHTVLRLELA